MATIDVANFNGVQFVTTNEDVVSQMILTFNATYTPNAVHFDANSTGDYFYIDPANTANANQLTFSIWVKPYAADAQDNVTNLFDRGFYGGGVEAFLDWTNSRIFVDGGSGGNAFELVSNNQLSNVFTTEWHHVLVSVDIDANVGLIYVDDVQCKDYFFNPKATMQLSGVWTFGAASACTYGQSNADKADLWINPSFIDISVEANRRKFVTDDLKPVFLGANGELVTGSVPAVYLGGNATSYDNFGYAGSLTPALSNNALENVTPP